MALPIAIILIDAAAALGLTALAKFGLWFYEVKTNHLPHIQAAAEEARDAVRVLPAAMERQTAAIVGELKEQRADLRSLTSAIAIKN